MKKKIIYTVLFLIIIIFGVIGWKIFGPTANIPEKKYLYIATGQSFENVKKQISDENIVNAEGFWFNYIAKKLDYNQSTVKSGRYEIKHNTSMYSLIKMLRNGTQSPVALIINKIRTKEDLAKKIGANFECDSLSFISFLNNNDSIKKYNLDSNTELTAIIPNTYNILWNTPASKIFKKLYTDQEKFWNAERKKKAAALHLTPQQIYILASIVEEETNKEEDKGNIASVYMNRLAKGMKLGADPTVKFAMKDFGLKRILIAHTKFPSAFNTYQNKGLPPGPICTPSSKTIDAVLNAPQTNYLFFVAKPDLKGYSNFAATEQEHMQNAKLYHDFLDSLTKAKAAK